MSAEDGITQRRWAVVAKTLLYSKGGCLKDHVEDAKEIVAALDEFDGWKPVGELVELPAFALTPAQEIRGALTVAILAWDCWDVQPGTEDGFARELAKVVAPIARYVESGSVEPLPSLETAEVADAAETDNDPGLEG